MNSESFQSHVLEDIPVYLTGGLSSADREGFESHIAGCATCAAGLADAKAMDDLLQQMFADVNPGDGFENRMIAGIRERTTRRTLHPLVRRVAIGVAATLLLGSAGVFYQRNSGRFEQIRMASNLKQIGQAMVMYSKNERNGGEPRSFLSLKTQDLSPDTFLSPVSGNVYDRKGKFADDFAHKSTSIPLNRAPGAFSLDGRTITLKEATASAGMMDTESIPSRTPGLRASISSLNTYTGGTSVVGGKLNIQDGQIAPTTGGPATGYYRFARDTSGDGIADARQRQSGNPQAAKVENNYDSILTPTSTGDDVAAATPTPASTTPPTQVTDASKLAEAPPAKPQVDKAGGEEQTVAFDKGGGQQAVPPASPAALPTAPDETTITSRKIIREGEMTFEVDSFDSTVMTIGKIVAEETGFVSTTDSDKLANGKVRGTVVVRVPPEHLDTLVLKLRGIGDLKSQKITAQDITKQYTDLESELRAARAMEERLLDIIKNGKGAVKDLLEAEKQLGVWREKIEQVEGEIRYDNNLVSLSTLSITLMERDIKAAASTSINEQVTMSLETDKVEQAYETARQAIDNAKGRITQSELKQFDAGQFGATIKAQLPPDQADAVIARIRQLDGRIANFQRERNQNSEGGSGAPVDASKVKHEDVTLALTIYNLANIAPRRTTTLTIVANDVDAVYSVILDQASKAGAKVVSSNLNHPRPDQSNGTISLSAASDKADALLATLRANGELLGQESSDNPDTQNITDAKRGVIVQVISLASVQARQSETLGIASTDVPAAFAGILDTLRASDARIVASQLNQQDPTNQTATIVFDISRTARPSVDATFDKLGEVFSRNITRSPDTANTLDSKVHCELTLQSADVLPARQTTTLAVEVGDVQKSVEQLLSTAGDMGGREIDKDISQDQNGRSVAHVIVEVPLSKADALSDQVESWGHRRSRQVTHDAQAPTGKLARGRLEVTLADAAAGLGGEETTWDAISHGLAVSGQGLRWSVQMLVIGACIVVPWILVIWAGWRLLRRRRVS